PSGGGNTTIAKAVLARRPDVGYSVSATTRPPRPGEQYSVAYHFLSRNEFARRRDAGEFVEWAEYAGEWYGTLQSEVDRVLRSERHVLLDIDVQGAAQVQGRYRPPQEMRIVTPSEVATQTQNKYLGVLVAAKFARFVNDFPRDRSVDLEQKLTTRALDELVRARLKYRLVRRRRQEV